ncbi:MAG: hypothetical protein KatS3mg023_2065 [Armatimonadota bacterium]|nr:MAG: hypothetical protein KatS3mg023_2065 [Armatimonadota bacterium]
MDFEQLLSRSFSELELPEEPGWGLFAPSGNSLQIQVWITDRQGRLGRVEFHNAETWQLVGSIWANTYRTEAVGVFSVPADLRACPHCRHNVLPVMRRYASRYFSAVFVTTSSGRLGAGGVLSQPVLSSQSRTYCLSKLGWERPGT